MWVSPTCYHVLQVLSSVAQLQCYAYEFSGYSSENQVRRGIERYLEDPLVGTESMSKERKRTSEEEMRKRWRRREGEGNKTVVRARAVTINQTNEES